MEAIQLHKPADYFELKKVANQAMEKTLEHYFQVFHTGSY